MNWCLPLAFEALAVFIEPHSPLAGAAGNASGPKGAIRAPLDSAGEGI
jgi:hypothetical protein